MATKERVVTAAEDKPYEIEVKLGTLVDAPSISHRSDKFAKKTEELKKLDGLSPAFKRSITRSLQKFYRGADGAESKRIEPEAIATGYTLFDVIEPVYNQDYLAALFEKSAPHASAIKAKVRNIVALGYDFVETDKTKDVIDRAGDDAEKLVRIRRKLSRTKQDLLDWIDSCNDEDTFTETLIKVWTDYEATGNGYIEIGRTVGGEIGYIGHIPATTVRIRRKRDGYVQIISNRAVFFRNFGDKKTVDPIGGDQSPNEVIHLKKYTPTNGYYGLSDIVSALMAVVGNEFAARFNLDYFENKAVPRYIVVIKGGILSDDSERDLLEFFQSSVKGKNHRTIVVPLPPDDDTKKTSFEMKPIENGIQDSSFNNYHKGNLNDILMAHGVPATKLPLLAEDIPLAAAKDFDKTFKEQVCQPEQSILEQKLGKIIKEKTDIFKLKLNELSLTDAATQSQIDERDIRNQILVPNEVRARRGLPGRDGGDKPVDLKGNALAQAKASTAGTKQRDQQRAANSTDSPSSTNVRAPKGEGRQQA